VDRRGLGGEVMPRLLAGVTYERSVADSRIDTL
jgi:hypothetical protein